MTKKQTQAVLLILAKVQRELSLRQYNELERMTGLSPYEVDDVLKQLVLKLAKESE